MPFAIRRGGDDCPFEVYNSETDERAEGGCHQNRSDAIAHQRALQSNVDDAAALVAATDPQPGEHFRAIAHTEGKSTGMRTFTDLSWRDPPFAFHWQYGSSAHGGTPMTEQVGLVTRVTRDPEDESIIYQFGHLDLGGERGREYARQLVAGFQRWVSIGLDEQPAKMTLEWAEEDDEDVEALDPLGRQPEQINIEGGCIGELSGVSVPAQADATIEPTAELVRELEELGAAGPPTDAAVPPQFEKGGGKDGKGGEDGERECPEGQTWDPDAGECVPTGDLAPAAAVEGEDECPDGSMWDPDAGECVPVPDDGMKSHPRVRGRMGIETAEDLADYVQAVTAASYMIEIPDLPPASWFDEPADIDIPGAFCVDDNGRVYGILAPLRTNHRAFARSGRRMEVPTRNVDYSRFLGGEALTREGRLAGVGPITMDCGHAGRFRADHDVAPAHYENACTVVAKVRIGQRADGLPWVAGALEPGVTPDQVSRMLTCRLSGDWQPHPDKNGWQELVAALLVPAPGFAGERTGPTVTLNAEKVLVASSVPVRYIGDAGVDGQVVYDDPLEAITAAAASVGRSEWARRARRLNQAGILRTKGA